MIMGRLTIEAKIKRRAGRHFIRVPVPIFEKLGKTRARLFSKILWSPCFYLEEMHLLLSNASQ
jgi:hypothetical protein